jgi:hypothetical protein
LGLTWKVRRAKKIKFVVKEKRTYSDGTEMILYYQTEKDVYSWTKNKNEIEYYKTARNYVLMREYIKIQGIKEFFYETYNFHKNDSRRKMLH